MSEFMGEIGRLREWRKALWYRHGCPSEALYGDDGEMQCSRCLIDFRRMPIEEITATWERKARAALAGWKPSDPVWPPSETTP